MSLNNYNPDKTVSELCVTQSVVAFDSSVQA